MATRHPWRLALGLWAALVALEAAAAWSTAAEDVLFLPERLLGVPARFAERPDAVAGPFPPTLASDGAAVLYPVVVPVVAAFAFAQITRHARLAYWLAFALFASFPFVWSAVGAARFEPRILREALGWGAAIGAVAGLVAGPRARGTMSRGEAAPVLGLLALGALALYPVAVHAPAALPWAAVVYAFAGALVAWLAGKRWAEHAVSAAAASGGAFGLGLAAELSGAGSGVWAALLFAPLWVAGGAIGVAQGKRGAPAPGGEARPDSRRAP